MEFDKRLPEYCIWDFNGTILDDVETGIRSVNHLLSQRGLKELCSREEYQSVFCFPIIKYYQNLGFDFSKESYEELAPLWVEQYMINVRDARMFDDVRRTLERFRALGIRQTVLSATERNMLRGQLESLGISDFFEEILGLDNIHAASKLALAKDWRARHPEVRAIFLGDTDHDRDTARDMEAECVLISRGHQSARYLETLGAAVYPTLDAFCEDRL